MQQVARAMLAMLVAGTLGLPYARPLVCGLGSDTSLSSMHGEHSSGHPMETAVVVTPGSDAPTCHDAVLCGQAHVAPVASAPAVWDIATADDGRTGVSSRARYAPLTYPPPPPRA